MKDRNLRVFMLIATAMILPAIPASAHHSFAAEYDANNPVTLTGSVTKMAWINPHSWIYIEVKKPDGKTENWAVEAGPPGTLIRAGFTKESLAPGTVIVVNGYRAKDGALRANGRDITLPDGRLLFVPGSAPDAPKNFPAAKK
ncbi:MAG TPA: DUF6152 family protein [Xanthobacteraceae bacterium]|jgi:hypothetical protein